MPQHDILNLLIRNDSVNIAKRITLRSYTYLFTSTERTLLRTETIVRKQFVERLKSLSFTHRKTSKMNSLRSFTCFVKYRKASIYNILRVHQEYLILRVL